MTLSGTAVRCDKAPLFTETASLHCPPLAAIATALTQNLNEHFQDVDVKVVPCPDLMTFGLASKGMGGSNCLVDIGGVPNLLDPAYHHLSYSMKDIAECIGMESPAIFGASSADISHVGHNAELMPTEDLQNHRRCSMLAEVDTTNGDACVLRAYDWSRIGYLGNLFASEGLNGEVLRIEVKKRTSDDTNFVGCIRQALLESFPGKSVGMGGVFKLVEGRFKAHVMPDVKKTVMADGPEVDAWLKFYDFGSGATYFSTLLSSDPTEAGALNLRLEHTHFFNRDTGEGGHYHHDTTPEKAHYVGYFVPAQSIFRIENAFDRSRCAKC